MTVQSLTENKRQPGTRTNPLCCWPRCRWRSSGLDVTAATQSGFGAAAGSSSQETMARHGSDPDMGVAMVVTAVL